MSVALLKCRPCGSGMTFEWIVGKAPGRSEHRGPRPRLLDGPKSRSSGSRSPIPALPPRTGLPRPTIPCDQVRGPVDASPQTPISKTFEPSIPDNLGRSPSNTLDTSKDASRPSNLRPPPGEQADVSFRSVRPHRGSRGACARLSQRPAGPDVFPALAFSAQVGIRAPSLFVT
jgi:hypothetical protein